MTSHDVVDRIRKMTGEKRVGHAGTLDPNATGLLVVGVGREFTKKLGKISKNTKKTYSAVIFLGITTATDDTEGEILEKISPTEVIKLSISETKVKKTLKGFLGKQKQMPPIYSAIKVKGKPAYKYARGGEKVKLKSREIEVFEINLIKFMFPFLEIECVVGSGTYIRSLARDIGEQLGVGGHLMELRRTKIGDYDIKNATVMRS